MSLSEKRLIQNIQSKVSQLEETLLHAEFWYKQLESKTQSEHQTRLDEFKQTYEQEVSAADETYKPVPQKHQRILAGSKTKYETALNEIITDYANRIETITIERQHVIETTNYLTKGWDASIWDEWKPTHNYLVPEVVRFGQLSAQGHWETQIFPAFLPLLVNGRSALFKATGIAREEAVQAIQSFLLRLLAVVPPGKLRFTFIDPVALGHNAAPFMHLADHDETLVTARAWSEKSHIERQLVDLTDHISNVIQKYLRNQYATIEEYNEQAGEIAEPYRLLVVMDFPVNFSEDAARRLVSIVQNGPRCGVYSIILYDPQQKLPYGFNVNDFEEFTTVINSNNNQFVMQDPDFQELTLELDVLPDEGFVNRIVNEIGRASIEANKVEVPFEKVLEKAQLTEEYWWQGSTADGIQVPLGPIGAKKVQYLEFGKGTAQHALVAGKTGSGKSTLLHVLISTLTLKYSPDEVELYLIDFKKGVEFKTYATHQLPHARVIAVESEREFGLSVLEGLDSELKQRGDLFRNAGVDGVKDYRQKTNKQMPRILLLVDEFQEFFTEDDSLASRASQILDRLVRQGRAFGIHVLLGSQTLAGSYTLARSTVDQMAIRIALQCSETDSRIILSDDNPAARLLSRPGEAIYNSANGLIEGNNPFQVAWLPDEKQDSYLENVKTLASQRNQWPSKTQIVFEGNAPAQPEQNQALVELLNNPQWSDRVQRFSAWLGEPIAIKEATVANFKNQSGSNLLIVGQNDEAVMGILTVNILSLSVQYKPNTVHFYIADFGNVDAAHAHFLNYVSDMFPHTITYKQRGHFSQVVSTIAQELEKRLEHEGESLEKKTSIYLIVYGLQRARDLEKDDGLSGGFSFGNPEESTKPKNTGKLFSKILREGPDLGIHTIAWCDTYSNFQRRLDYRVLREFDMRIVFQMSEDDSTQLIDTKIASKLGQHRALFYTEEEGRIEKFRPFALPEERWLKKVGKKLNELYQE